MTESTRLRYVVHDRLVYDRPLPLVNKVRDIYFSLGKNFDQYNFKRQTVDQNQVDLALEARVHSLRQQHDYLRLWFSGGRDSRLILDSFVKYGVKLDEIVVARRCTKNNLGLFKEFDPLLEIDSSAVNYLHKNKNNFPNTKITIFDIDDPHHETFFERSKWYTDVSEWFFGVTYMPRVIHRVINPEFKLLDVSGPTCELVGSAIPTVYFNDDIKKWNFVFSCSSFNPIGTDVGNVHFEDFIITEENPTLFELHVNSIVDDYEKQGDHPDYTSNYRQQERAIRDRSLFFKKWTYDEIQLPKIDLLEFKFPSDHYFWMAGQSTRTYYEMINRWNQQPMARSLDLYINNTDWNLIRSHMKRPFKTKTWTLE